MKVEKIRAALDKPWLKAGIMCAMCSSLIVSIYFSEDRWAALSTIGTIGAVFVALYLSFNAKLEESRKRRVEAMIYIWGINPEVRKLENFLAESANNCADGVLDSKYFLLEVAGYQKILREYNYSKLYDFDQNLCQHLTILRNGMGGIIENFHHPAQTKDSRVFMLNENWKVANRSNGFIRHHDPSGYIK